MPTNNKSTTSIKTSSKKPTIKGAKALAKKLQVSNNGSVVAANPNAIMSIGLSAFEVKEENDRAPLKLLISNRSKPILVNEEFLILEGNLDKQEEVASSVCLFSQNPYSPGYQRFKIGEKFDYIHVLRTDTKTEYILTLKNCTVKRIEFRVGKRNEFDRDLRPNEQTIFGFEEKVIDKEAEKLYNMTLGKNR